jgi:hypothetical protein
VIDERNISARKININDLNQFNRPDLSTNKESIDLLIAEGGENFYRYIDRIGLSNEPDIIHIYI